MAELNGNERAALVGQCVALRNVLDGIIASLQEGENAEPVCGHPLEQRKYATGAMGSDAGFTCGQCGQTINSGA